jgi:micrococcal nuclease
LVAHFGSTASPASTPATTVAGNCAPSYPDVCIPPPPDLDCGQISYRNFRVVYTVPNPDPHRFDGDHDGIGCES